MHGKIEWCKVDSLGKRRAFHFKKNERCLNLTRDKTKVGQLNPAKLAEERLRTALNNAKTTGNGKTDPWNKVKEEVIRPYTLRKNLVGHVARTWLHWEESEKFHLKHGLWGRWVMRQGEASETFLAWKIQNSWQVIRARWAWTDSYINKEHQYFPFRTSRWCRACRWNAGKTSNSYMIVLFQESARIGLMD